MDIQKLRIEASADGSQFGVAFVEPETEPMGIVQHVHGMYHRGRGDHHRPQIMQDIAFIVGYMDYKKKEAGFKTIITDLSDKDRVMRILHDSYEGVNAKYPENFLLPKINSSKQ